MITIGIILAWLFAYFPSVVNMAEVETDEDQGQKCLGKMTG